MAGWSIARRLFAIDILAMAFVTALGGATAARAAQIPGWPAVILGCAGIALAVPLLGFLRTHLDLAPVRLLHDWSFVLYLAAIHRMVLLVAAPGDVAGAPTDWLVAASGLLPVSVAVELYARDRERRFRQWAFVSACVCVIAFGALLLPRSAVPAVPAAQPLATVLTVAWAWRYRLQVRGMVTVAGVLLAVAAAVLRARPVGDVLAGAMLALLCLVVAPALHRWLAQGLGTLDADRAA